MGAVYEAVHRDLKKRVAVKVLMASLAANEEARQRFLREGEAASRIRHPHVVDVTDVGSDGSLSYLVMEFLEGEDLANHLARVGPMSEQEIADILLPVCAGLAAAHDEGVIHRDLKPENIFLAHSRHGGLQPKVLDFGVSKVSGGAKSMALTGTAATFGTPFYMPPEQLRGARQADHKSDQYAMGVVLYECLTGRRPFEAENIYAMLRAIGDGDFPLPRTVRPDLSETMELIIVRAMRLEASDRFSSIREFAGALLPFASETSRMLWSAEFGATYTGSPSFSPGRTVALPSQTPSQVPTSPGRRKSTTGGSVSGTRIMPSSPSSPPRVSTTPRTTLGSSTGQRFDMDFDVRPKRGPGLAIAIGVLVIAGGGGAGYYFLRPQAETHGKHGSESSAREAPSTTDTEKPAAFARPSFRVDVEADPPATKLELDGVPVGEGYFQREFPKDGREHRLVGHAIGYEDGTLRFTDSPPPRRLILKLQPPEPEHAVTPPPAETPTPTVAHAVRPPPPGHHAGGGHHPHGGGTPTPTAPTAAQPKPPSAQPPATSPSSVPANGAPVID
jgi:serine/threonine-protein kinase